MANQDNKAIWEKAFTTDPQFVKPITGKQYQGSSPSPYWIVQRATEIFGPCGIGWGYNIQSERIERFSDTDTVHIAMVEVWYMHEGKRGSFQHIGQTKMSYKTSKGSMMLDEDAPKKSVTDALVKGLSMIGFAGDIFLGRWDDSGYIREAAELTRERIEDEAQAKTLAEASRVHSIMEAAAKQGKDAFAKAWKGLTIGERNAFGGSSKLVQFEDAVKQADAAIKAQDAEAKE